MEVKKEKLFATVGIYLCVHVRAERAGWRFWGELKVVPDDFITHARLHEPTTIVVSYPRSSHIY